MVANENLGLAARLNKAHNVEITTLRFSVEVARADAVVASSKNAQLINQVKGNQVECGALVKQLGEMREHLEELTEQKFQFCKQVAELQGHMSTVSRKREATVCPCEATRGDVELFQSQAERLEYERCELTVSRKHRHWLAAWRQPHNLVGSKAHAYRWCRKSHDSACLQIWVGISPEHSDHVSCLYEQDRRFPLSWGIVLVRYISLGRWRHMLPQSQGSCLHQRDMGFLYLWLLCVALPVCLALFPRLR